MDDKPLLNDNDREGLIERLKRLENEIEDIKKRLCYMLYFVFFI